MAGSVHPKRWKTGNTVGMHCANMSAVEGHVKAVPLHGSEGDNVFGVGLRYCHQ